MVLRLLGLSLIVALTLWVLGCATNQQTRTSIDATTDAVVSQNLPGGQRRPGRLVA
ncbi:MAG: hypothetical protein OER80_14650 [Gammaproteobacteria bacterium]|nr:hypothetical protein [Gammaproteobacteria bacterium]